MTTLRRAIGFLSPWLSRGALFAVATLSTVSACAERAGTTQRDISRRIELDLSDQPQAEADAEELARFARGDALFEAVFREADGLGPLYIRSACVACHQDDARGPGLVTRLVSSPAPAPFGDTLRPYATAGATTPIALHSGAHAGERLPPAVFGRGHLEAVAEAEIERLEREARARKGSLRGRIHRLPGGGIGRFGLKARSPSLDEFTADALHGDMGLTSPQRPEEPANPDGLRDDHKPGLDVDAETVVALADYVRLLELPARKAATRRGAELFEVAQCATCHVPRLKTREDYSVRRLAGQTVAVYTDFLLHDMGAALADGVVEGNASGSEWRTAPLIGLRFLNAYLHDGRAKSVEEAVLLHGGADSEAEPSLERYRALNADERATLLSFVEQL